MSKKKEVKVPSILDGIDMKLSRQHEAIIRDIEEIQYEIQRADKKKAKKAKKKLKNGKIGFYEVRSSKARIHAAKRLTSSDVVSVIKNILMDIKPIMVLLARLVAAIICSILSMDIVKRNIGKTTLGALESLYNLCMGVIPAQA